MIFKAKKSFAVFIVSVSPGIDGHPYVGKKEMMFSRQPTPKEVIEAIKEQEVLYSQGAVKMENKYGIPREKVRRKQDFVKQCIGVVKRKGIPNVGSGSSSCTVYEEGPKGRLMKHLAYVTVERRYVKRLGKGKPA